ncbi:MAG: tripartite tricarboxylate transporter substrate binding protein [Hyphomicrobiaceae bacterium]|nr:tripartite tricarboxylate transporter substrate binding protein [Hyphomicrobiaceae bacterium]
MLRTALGAAVGLALSASMALAQAFPDKAINLMVAYPPGGSTDIGARIVAGIAEKIIGQPIVVVNKGGAGGQVGWTDLTRQKPDGYNIGFVNLPATNTVILDKDRQAIFDENSFTPIINQVLDPGVVWVAANSPFKTLKDLVTAAKAKPGELKAATTGILSDDHLAILMLEEAEPGVKFRLVHLVGGAAQMKETLGGNVDVSFDNVGSIVTQVKAGQVRALAVMDDVRSKFFPDVPTTKELGYPKVISSSTRGIAGPKGMDPKVVAKLAETFKKAMEDPEHQKKMDDVGLAVKIMTGDEYKKYFADIHAQAKKYTEWAKARPQK